ncbi:MAG: serpin family protein, partial [Polyangiaceae bacterium]
MRSHLILAALMLAACNSSSSSTPPLTPAPVSSSTTATSPSAVAAVVAPAPSSTIADPGRTAIEASRPTATAINATNAALYAQLAKTPGNLIYSPASIETALAMTAAGAKGTTLTEMQKTLHLAADPNEAAKDFSALLASWAQTAPNAPTLAVANHIWV